VGWNSSTRAMKHVTADRFLALNTTAFRRRLDQSLTDGISIA
jgi:hypothetical protein